MGWKFSRKKLYFRLKDLIEKEEEIIWTEYAEKKLREFLSDIIARK